MITLDQWQTWVAEILSRLYMRVSPGDTTTPKYAVYYELQMESRKRFGVDFIYSSRAPYELKWFPQDRLSTAPVPPLRVRRVWAKEVLGCFYILDQIIEETRANEWEEEYIKEQTHAVCAAKKALNEGCEKLVIVRLYRTKDQAVVGLRL